MAKMRVHELAKEIEKQSKEIINYLAEKGIEKSASSSLDDGQVDMVRKAFGAPAKAEPKPAEGKAEATPEAGAAAAQQKAEQPKKKKKPNIIFVSNPQNSRSRDGKPAQRPENRPNVNVTKHGAGITGVIGRGAKQGAKPAQPEARPAQQPQTAGQQAQQPVKQPEQAQARPVNQAQNSQERPAQQPQSSQSRPVQQPQGGQSRPAQQSQGGQGRPVQQAQGSQNRPAQQSQGGQNRPAQQAQNGQGRTGQQSSQQRPERRDNRGQQGQGGGNRGGDGRDSRRPQQGAQNERKGPQTGANSGRPGDNFNRGQKRTDRPDDRRRPAVPAADAAAKEAEKRREEQSKRRQTPDKRKKDQVFTKKVEDGFKGKNTKNVKKPRTDVPPQRQEPVKVETIKVITLPEALTIKELAEKMKLQPSVIVKKLFLQGKVVTVNQEISYEQAEEIAIEFDIICEKEEVIDVIEELLREEEEDVTDMTPRPPVICVMGHVDHGKTSLLDAIRKTNVIDREAGGITQHIGAYVVNINNQKITFLDTPGHEAFTAMRMRGANATDIAILVVAADDGVMPQTVEAINHAKAAGIEIIVAVNKIDKPSANIDKVKQELAEYELIPEDWGGSTVYAPVSAKSGEGIEQLLEMILLTAEILELKANAKRQARGLVIEAELDKGRGPVATVLVQKGTLHVGDFIAAGACHGKVRAMIDDKGRRVKEATPSTPVEILGLNDVPNAGEVFVAPDNDKEARNFASTFISQNRVKMLEDTKSKMSLDDLFSQIQAGNLKELNLIIKADVQGSVEAVKQSMLKLSNEEVVVKVIHGGVGAINESDVSLASASNAIIIGFNVRPDATAKSIADTEGVDLRLYKVIYQAIEDVEAAMKGMLDPVFEEKVLGHAEIRQIFKASGIGSIAGSYVLDGVFQRGCSVRISRAGEQIFEGPLASLKRFKDDVKEVKAGFECGLVFDGFHEIEELDVVEAYTMVEVPR